MNFGAILAAGFGVRMKRDFPKQFIDLCGKPIIIRTIERMLKVKMFDFLLIAIHPDYKERLVEILNRFDLADEPRIIVITGGKERINTIENVVNYAYELNHNENDVLVLHDAVRPFVSLRILEDSIKTASEYGACVATVPAIDTMYISDSSNSIVSFPDRRHLYHGQTPDSFKLGVLRNSIKQLNEQERKDLTGTTQICVAKGYTVKTIPGDYKNIKITTESDLLVAEAFLKNEAKDEGLCSN